MSSNRATIYSNGIADFQRVFQVTKTKPRLISIPVRQQHLADVLASLTVSGKVRVERPPSFQPANQDDGNIVLSSSNSLIDLAQQLGGADVEIEIAKKTVTGKLIGVQGQEVGTSGEPVTEQSLVVLTDEGIRNFSLRQIEALRFVDDSIAAEINKALSRKLRDIKPNSTFVELELSTTAAKTNAIVQYTIPAAAWKISYRIILTDDEKVELHGHAIVDNNTDEDWKDFLIAVVMGQPITFSTDLAVSKTPRRNHVNIVQESAIGSVEVEEGMDEMAIDGLAEPAMLMSAAPQKLGAMRKSRSAMKRKKAATIDEAEIADTGDFCIFESAQPVSIDAHHSAVIPVFQTQLDHSKSVLHFKADNHPERPYRSIRLRNTTPHSLGRGVCTVYDQATYVGNCIVPSLQPDKTALVPHALETSVRVRHQPRKIESRRIGLQISEGVASENYHKLLRTEYLFNSHRDQSLTLVLDHDVRLDNCHVVCHLFRKTGGSGPASETTAPVELELETLKNGRRVEIELLPNDVVEIVFIETSVAKSQMRLTGSAPEDDAFHVHWLYENLIESNASLLQEPAVARCLELQKLLDENNSQIQHAQAEHQRLLGRQERLRKNIQAGVSDQQAARWQDDLARAEDNLVQLEEEHLPELIAEQRSTRQQLYAALHELAIQWSE